MITSSQIDLLGSLESART